MEGPPTTHSPPRQPDPRGRSQQVGVPCEGSERSSGGARGGSLPDALKMLLKYLPLQLAEGKKETLKQNKQQGINTLCFPQRVNSAGPQRYQSPGFLRIPQHSQGVDLTALEVSK